MCKYGRVCVCVCVCTYAAFSIISPHTQTTAILPFTYSPLTCVFSLCPTTCVSQRGEGGEETYVRVSIDTSQRCGYYM